jgi:hypothetical protein
MPERMGPDILLDASPACSTFDGVVDRFGGQVFAIGSILRFAWKEIQAWM